MCIINNLMKMEDSKSSLSAKKKLDKEKNKANFKSKFGEGSDFFEDQFINQRVGLTYNEEFKRRRLEAKAGSIKDISL